MSNDCWVLATDDRRLGAMVATGRGTGGRVTLAAVGPRSLADAAAAAGPDAVAWVECGEATPAEAYAGALASVIASAAPRLVLAMPSPQGRVLLGAAATALEAVIVAGVTAVRTDGPETIIERADLGGRVLETLATRAAVAGLFGGDDAPAPSSAAAGAPIEPLALSAGGMRIEGVAPVPGATGGVTTADRIVAVGRGLKAKADLAIVEELATALGAEIACSMPIADDFGWVAKERYIGRSGQHIAPRLYLALGISGASQHLEGIRDAKVVVAVNSDPGARIFGRADYGIVGDLYDVVPAIVQALAK